MATLINLYPLNDLNVKVHLDAIDPMTGDVTPITSGTITAFLAASNASSATAADVSLEITPTSLGGGDWLCAFDADILDPTLLATLFTSATPYLIVQSDGGIRTYVTLKYMDARPATVS